MTTQTEPKKKKRGRPPNHDYDSDKLQSGIPGGAGTARQGHPHVTTQTQVSPEAWMAVGSAGGTLIILVPLQLKALRDIGDLRERMARVEERTEDPQRPTTSGEPQ